jgi:hypothetical protein
MENKDGRWNVPLFFVMPTGQNLEANGSVFLQGNNRLKIRRDVAADQCRGEGDIETCLRCEHQIALHAIFVGHGVPLVTGFIPAMKVRGDGVAPELF